jgi:hypothetical protein
MGGGYSVSQSVNKLDIEIPLVRDIGQTAIYSTFSL